MMQAALQFGYFKFNIRCLQFVCKFQAERDQYFLRRQMHCQNAVRVGDTVEVLWWPR